MDDLTSELILAALALGIVLRACWQGNHWPCFWTAIGGLLMAVAAAIRHLELSDVVVPALTAFLAAIIGLLAHTARPRSEVRRAD